MSPAPGEGPALLHETLLQAPALPVEPVGPVGPVEGGPARRWAYALWGMLLVSAFVLYHGAVLLIWNTPKQGLMKPFHSTFLKQVKGYEYFQGTRNTQSWAMFAPNPNRSNAFVRVFVKDSEAKLWDFNQDIWEQDRYPYIWYDRRGKVNRRIDGNKQFQRIYGAWVCREWERIHGGEAPKSVSFVRRLTMVPHAQTVLDAGGWDQWAAPAKQVEQETVTCKTVVHGTLPNELRERYGLPLIDEDKQLRKVANRSWWAKQEAERARAAKTAERDAPPAPSRRAKAPPEPDPDPAPAPEEDAPEY